MSKEITEKIAISILNSARPRKGSYDRLQAAFDMAIEALQKQIPKKPIFSGLYACPCCRTIMLRGSFESKGKHCKECGQKIDWSAEYEEH